MGSAIVKDGRKIIANKVYTQTLAHEKWGGVVPELASREHLLLINQIVNETLNDASLGFKYWQINSNHFWLMDQSLPNVKYLVQGFKNIKGIDRAYYVEGALYYKGKMVIEAKA